MKENQILKEYEIAISECETKYHSILEEIKELEDKPVIKKYKKLETDLSMLSKRYARLRDEYSLLYQSTCKHPLWYFLEDDSDRFEGRQKWVCKCIKCGKIETEHSREFKDKLIIESGNMGFGERCLTDYGIVRNEYQTLVDSNKKNIAKTLIKKYNNQKKQ